MTADRVVDGGGMRRIVMTLLAYAASLFCMLALGAAIYAFLSPAGVATRGVIMLVVAAVLAFLAVRFDDARQAARPARRS